MVETSLIIGIEEVCVLESAGREKSGREERERAKRGFYRHSFSQTIVAYAQSSAQKDEALRVTLRKTLRKPIRVDARDGRWSGSTIYGESDIVFSVCSRTYRTIPKCGTIGHGEDTDKTEE